IAEIDRLANVVSSLLGFARPLQLDSRAVAVAELFDHATLLAAGELEAKRVRVERHTVPGLPLVHGDPDLLSQVLLGLLGNAADAVPPGGTIGLDATAADGIVRIHVSDSGPGVPVQLRSQIFEPFFTTR